MTALLQFGVPGGPELLILLLILVIPLAVAYWVYNDARRRGVSYAPAWALGVLALLLAGFVPGLLALAAYFYVREKQSAPSPSP